MNEPLDPYTQPAAADGAAAPAAHYPAPPGYAAPPPPGYSVPPPPGYAVAPRSTNGFAIASMVLGIVWIYWIGSILALIFGYVALNQIRQRDQNGKGMAIAGVVLGWVGVAVIPIIVIAVFALGSSVKSQFHDTCDQFSQNGTGTTASCQ